MIIIIIMQMQEWQEVMENNKGTKTQMEKLMFFNCNFYDLSLSQNAICRQSHCLIV